MQEFTIGPTAVSTRDSGRIIKWRASVCSNGPMAASTKVSTSMTKRKEKVSFTGKSFI